MTDVPLADTLMALLEGLDPPDGSGLVIDSARLDVPLEGRVIGGPDGPVFNATVPHTRWVSGLLPAVHVAHLDAACPQEGV